TAPRTQGRRSVTCGTALRAVALLSNLDRLKTWRGTRCCIAFAEPTLPPQGGRTSGTRLCVGIRTSGVLLAQSGVVTRDRANACHYCPPWLAGLWLMMGILALLFAGA